MNMRQHKHSVLSKVFFGAAFAAMLSEFHDKAYALMDAPPVRDPILSMLADRVLDDSKRVEEVAIDVISKHHSFEQNISTPIDSFSREIQEEMAEMAKLEFVCLRLKDHVVVDSFDTREEALELVRKHIKQKKAKLYVITSLGETIPFSEEELAV